MIEMIPVNKLQISRKYTMRMVDKEGEQYLGLKDSIRIKGFCEAIIARYVGDMYEICNGLHRWTAAKALGLKEIPVDVRELTDQEFLELQISMNVHVIKTDPIAYAKALRQLVIMLPNATHATIAASVGKSGNWLSEMLGLTNLMGRAEQFVADGTIKISKAYFLAKVPVIEMDDWVDDAMNMHTLEFKRKVLLRVREIKDSKWYRTPRPKKQAYFRKITEIKRELERSEVAPGLCQDIDTAEKGFHLALQWILHLN